MHDSHIITSQDHVLLLYCISPEMRQAEVAHNELKWRHVCGVSGPLRGQDHLLDKTSQLKICLSACQSILIKKNKKRQKDKCVLTWLLFPGAQSVLLLTEKVASIIQHTADTAPLMLNSKTMRPWSALPADMRLNDAYNSFLNDRIFNEGTASEISSINKTYYAFSQDFPKQSIPLLRLTDSEERLRTCLSLKQSSRAAADEWTHKGRALLRTTRACQAT